MNGRRRPQPMSDAEVIMWLIVGVLWMIALSLMLVPPDIAATPLP